MGGHDDFADWRGAGGYREERGGGHSGFYTPGAEADGDLRMSGPRGGDGRFETPGEVPTMRVDWDRRGAVYGQPDPGYGQPESGYGQPESGYGQPHPGYDRDAGYGAVAGGYGAPETNYGSPEGYATERPFGMAEPGRGNPGSEMTQRGPRSGEPLPPPPPPMQAAPPAEVAPAQPLRERTEMVDAAALRRSVADSDGVYRSKRPALAIAFGILAGLGELLMLVPLVSGMFEPAAGRALAPLLAMMAFPLLSLGLYGLSTGAATAVQFQGSRVWLRTPLVYLPVAIGLLIAAGAAA